MLCERASLPQERMAACTQETNPPAVQGPAGRGGFREVLISWGSFKFLSVDVCSSVLGTWLYSVAVYSLGFPPLPVVILQIHVPKMNSSRGSSSDTGGELDVVILDYGEGWNLFEILGSGLVLSQK